MADKAKALELAKKVEGYINKEQLDAAEIADILEETKENYDNHVNSGWLPYREEMFNDPMFSEWSHAKGGEFVADINGRELIDCLGGFGIYLNGHDNREIIETVKAQLDRYAQHEQDLVNPLQGYFSKLMAEVTPGDLQYVWPTNGGTEATEAAMKLAKLATGGRWFITTIAAYHGLTTGALSLIGCPDYKTPFDPLYPYVMYVEYGNAEQLEMVVKNLQAGGEKVAAFICEPVQGEGGMVVPPEGYLTAVREICTKYEIAWIVDEIQSGMGRTGTLWRIEAEDVTPDIMTFGKAIGGGCVPLTGIIARPWMITQEAIDNPCLVSMPTFGGNPLAMAAGIASLRYSLENDVPGMCKAKGEYFKKGLEAVMAKHPDKIKDVRGVGLMLGVLLEDWEIAHKAVKLFSEKNILTSAAMSEPALIRFEPPAAISEESMDKVCAALDEIAPQL